MERAARELPILKMNKSRNPTDGEKLLGCFLGCHRMCEEVAGYGIGDSLGMACPQPTGLVPCGLRVAPKYRQRPFGQGGVLQ